ncbi:MAG: hypothetical protein RQ754_12925 [Desulfuromonadales bacterium]|nr:hypothetical protein [Desulfuromonadales bacterium]
MKKNIFKFIVIAALMALFSSPSWSASFLENEAGISASIHVSGVNISQAASAFISIEKQTDTYVIGSVRLPDYDENHDVHVYVDISGDIIAYYLAAEPPSKIIDWKHYSGGLMTVDGSKLEDALTVVCSAMSLTFSEVDYHDFRYPFATDIEIIVEENSIANSTDSFSFMIPSVTNYVYVHNISWSHSVKVSHDGYTNNRAQEILIDGNIINSGTTTTWNIWDGVIPEETISRDVYHSFSVVNNKVTTTASDSYTDHGALVILHSESVPPTPIP